MSQRNPISASKQALYLALYVGLFILAMAFRSKEVLWQNLAYGLLFLTPHGLAARASFQNARNSMEERKGRRAWLMIGCASAAFMMGIVVYSGLAICNNGVPQQFPNVSDVFIILYGPLTGIGMLALSTEVNRTRRVRIALDSLLLAGAIGALLWRFLLQNLLTLSDLPQSTRMLAVVYPFTDFAALIATLTLIGEMAAKRRQPGYLQIMAASALVWMIGDCAYAHKLMTTAHFEPGSYIDIFYFVGGSLVYLAAKHARTGNLAIHDQPRKVRRSMEWAGAFTPYALLAITVVAMLCTDDVPGEAISIETLRICIILVTLGLLRQMCTLVENMWLTDEAQRLNSNLEERVQQRTEQLDGLLSLTRALTGAIEPREVIDAALPHVRDAFHASAAFIWIASPTNEFVASAFHHIGLNDDSAIALSLANRALSSLQETVALEGSQDYCLRIPLEWYGERLGMLGVTAPKQVAEERLSMMVSIASEVSAALANAYRCQSAFEAADRDTVTGLFNHRAIQQRLETAFATAKATNASLSVMLVDISNFRLFNDTYGHHLGDSILRSVGEAIDSGLPEDSYLGRYGSDEFLAVMPGVTAKEALKIAEKLRERTECLGYTEEGDDRTIPVAIACGIATFPQDCADWHALPLLADENLFRAKQYGEQALATSPMRHLIQELRKNEEFETLDAMVTAVDNKDAYTRRHSEDVTQYALWIAEGLGVRDEQTLWSIRVGGLLHDVGKIGVPAQILLKPGRLTHEEYDTLKRHPKLGALIVGSVPGMEGILDAVRSHHERWDGRGYPDATAGKDTPWLGRLMAVADAFSAMTTDRPYRKGFPIEKALAEIEKGIGTQFDPEMAAAFLSTVRQKYHRASDSELRKAA